MNSFIEAEFLNFRTSGLGGAMFDFCVCERRKKEGGRNVKLANARSSWMFANKKQLNTLRVHALLDHSKHVTHVLLRHR